MNLIFLNYNNYYNRIIKRLETKAEYEAATANNTEFYDIQFNPNDGIFAEQLVNWNYSWTPDYMLEYYEGTNISDPPHIVSRWFVLEWVRTRGGQYKATLRRDVIADNYNVLLNAPIYVEKATIPTEDDVAIYNQENLELNKIKQNEYLLKDNTESAWLVGYFAKNIDFGSSEGQISRTINIKAADIDAITVNTLAGWSYNQYISSDYKLLSSLKASLYISLKPSAFNINDVGVLTTTGWVDVLSETSGLLYKATCSDVPTGGASVRRTWLRTNLLPDWNDSTADILSYIKTQENLKTDSSIIDLDGKNLFVETGTGAGYYKISVVNNGDTTVSEFYNANSQEEIYIANKITYADYEYPSSAGVKPCVKKDISYTRYRIVLTPITVTAATTLDWPVNANLLQDAPYGMFAMPASQVKVYASGSLQFTTPDDNDALNMMCTIAEHLGAYCYDIQKVPFCPNVYINSTAHTNSIDLTGVVLNKDYALIKTSQSVNKQIVLFCKDSTFNLKLTKAWDTIEQKEKEAKGQVYLPENISDILKIRRHVLDDHEDTYIEDYKISNQCDFYRMYSPNWAASFEFNVAKTGDIRVLDVDCTYKPYNPYIHISPVWSKLYGTDYDDYRGLIVQGDFSIPRIEDAWTQYQINNKNFLNSFNRQIDSLELSQSVERKQQAFNAAVGTLTGGIAGAAAGAKIGGGYGAIAGAAIGTTASAIGGALDVKYGEMLRNEALDLRVDQFNYSLQNIQALPDTLAKVSTYDANNKIFPVLEYYTCTYQEKLAFLNKMIYNGMTIMRIGTLNEFLDVNRHYFKGKLIRCEELEDDFHVLTAIAEELNKGVYI